MNNYVVHDIKLYMVDFKSFCLLYIPLSVNNTATSAENRGKNGCFCHLPPLRLQIYKIFLFLPSIFALN